MLKAYTQRSHLVRNHLPAALAIVVLGAGVLLLLSEPSEVAPEGVGQRFVVPVQGLDQGTGPAVSDSLYATRTQEVEDDPSAPIHPTVDIDETDHRLPVDAPLRGDPKGRDRVTYDNVINQFMVEENPRYQLRENALMYEGGVTYCNIFVWDVMRAMGVEIPYWVDANGEITEPYFSPDLGRFRIVKPAYWKNANDIHHWLNERGTKSGWREVTPEEAQDSANLGHPTVASLYIPYESGHMGIVRPGEMINGPALAQAGASNVNYAHVYDFFPRERTQFFVNDTGTTVERL